MSDSSKNSSTKAGGAHSWDDALRPWVTRLFRILLGKLFDVRYVDNFIRSLSPEVRKGAVLAPMAVAGLMAKIPESFFFNSPELADFVREVNGAALEEKFFLVRTEYLKDQLLHSLLGHYFAGGVFQLSLNA